MLPELFLKRMEGQLGDEYGAFLESLQRPRAVALRFNPLKGGRPHLDFALEAVPWEPEGVYYDPQSRPGLHPYHEAGVYYLQEASAMAPVALLAPQPGEWVCDLCAAPGGKSTQIAGRMAGQGFLLCNEFSPKRAKILSRNIERMGISNALVTNETPAQLARRLGGCFDRVLVDAPCSGEGMFRKEEAAVTDWSEEAVAMCAARQGEILEAAAKLVRPGGRLVYSTCTFAPQENEEAIKAFLEKHPEFAPQELEAPWFEKSAQGCFRLWPHKLLGEGHFAAVLRKEGQGREEADPEPGQKLPEAWLDFARELGIQLPEGKAVLFGTKLYWTPKDMPSLKGLKVERAGLELGELKKGRFEPSHALALWLRTCGRVAALEEAQVARYMAGDVIPGSIRGWVLVQVDGYSLGWGKGDGSMIKNHYPKGLRRPL